MVSSAFTYARINGREKALKQLSNFSIEDLEDLSRKDLKDYIIGDSIFGTFFSEESAERFYRREVAREILENGTRDEGVILYGK